MSHTQRFSDNYKLESIGGAGTVEIEATTLTVTGNLVVAGTNTAVNSTDLDIADKTIVLNKGETGAGVTSPVHSGIEIDRGTLTNTGLRYNDTSNKWELTNDGSTWADILAGATSAGIQNVVEDITPQLGGALDVNGQTITSASNGDIVVDPDGTGQLKINHAISLHNESDPSATADYNKLYAKTPSEGGSGVFFVNSTTSDELVSKTKAMVFALIF